MVMNRFTLVLRTPAVALVEFDHPPDAVHHDPEHEVSPHHSISFVEAGSFDARVDDRHWTLAPGSLFVTRQGMGFSCRHDHEMPTDRCLTLSYADDAVEDLMLAEVPPLQPPVAHMSARQRYLRHRLRSCVPGEEIRLDLLAGALFESLSARPSPAVSRMDARVTPLMRRIDRAIQRIEADYSRALTLTDLASAAGLSTYYFARTFQRLVGMPPHRFLTAMRLRHAARLLDDGAGVTFTCYEVGFGSLSHFVTAFRRRFGVVPSAARRGTRVPALRAAVSGPVWT